MRVEYKTIYTPVKNCIVFIIFFFNDTATTEIYTLSLHDALPILVQCLLWLGYIKLYLHHLRVWSYGLLFCGWGFWASEGFWGQIVMNSKMTRCPCNEKYITNQISNFLSSSSCPLTVTYTTCGRLGLNIAKAHPEPAFHLRKSSINTPRV